MPGSEWRLLETLPDVPSAQLLAGILAAEGIAVRTGHHCAMPVMTFFGLPATARASFGCYNTEHDVASLVQALGKAREVFA